MHKPDDKQDLKRALRVTAAITGYFLATLISLSVLFICAGSLDWLWGWAVATVMIVGGIIGIPLAGPELIALRSSVTRGSKSWDSWLAPVMARIGPLVTLVVAGLDFRFGWTGALPAAYGIMGLLCLAAGFAITTWAMHANKFFSYGVRIQKERGHFVIDTGPYRFVRHPGYVGGILLVLALPFALMSWWALVPALATTLVAIVRTALEDAVLKSELEGYPKYAEQVRYRLLPGVW